MFGISSLLSGATRDYCGQNVTQRQLTRQRPGIPSRGWTFEDVSPCDARGSVSKACIHTHDTVQSFGLIRSSHLCSVVTLTWSDWPWSVYWSSAELLSGFNNSLTNSTGDEALIAAVACTPLWRMDACVEQTVHRVKGTNAGKAVCDYKHTSRIWSCSSTLKTTKNRLSLISLRKTTFKKSQGQTKRNTFDIAHAKRS